MRYLNRQLENFVSLHRGISMNILKRAMPIKPNKKELFLINLEQSAKEVKSAIKCKKKLKTLEEALNEL